VLYPNSVFMKVLLPTASSSVDMLAGGAGVIAIGAHPKILKNPTLLSSYQEG